MRVFFWGAGVCMQVIFGFLLISVFSGPYWHLYFVNSLLLILLRVDASSVVAAAVGSSSSSSSSAAMATRHMVRRDAGAKRSSLTASGEIIFRNLIILIINQNFLMTQQFAKRHRPNYTFTNDSAPQHSQAGDSRFPFYPIT
ncbi:hypothetical protein T08_11284 [Trichinella sp. T8]|nr:hypothetical protein T08_11284 [Trichinella sp. T8]